MTTTPTTPTTTPAATPAASVAHRVPQPHLAETRARLAKYAIVRCWSDESKEDRQARTRADALAEARELKHRHGTLACDVHAIAADITPSEDDVARLAVERIGKAGKKK